MKNERSIFVYENWSEEDPIFLGTLFVNQARIEAYSFQYDENWLDQHTSFQFTLNIIKGDNIQSTNRHLVYSLILHLIAGADYL